MGYLFAVILQYVGAVYIFTLAAGIVFVGVGLFLFEIGRIEDIKMNLKSIVKRGDETDNLSWTLSEIAEFMQYRSALKQLSIEDNIVLFCPYLKYQFNHIQIKITTIVGSSLVLWKFINRFLWF